MLVLRTLVLSPLHGYGISKAIRANSSEALDIEFGSLYPALKRLEVKGWVSAKWEVSENNRKAKYYRLTGPAGNSFNGSIRNGLSSFQRWRKSWAQWPKEATNERSSETKVPSAWPPQGS